MGYMVDNPSHWTPERTQAGYVQVNKRVFKGVVRDLRDGKILWRCDHVHSRPEYNARWQFDPVMVWEYSALNCGQEAELQWRLRNVSGQIGLVGLDLTGFVNPRDDVKDAHVGSVLYTGRVWLSEDGNRILSVRRQGDNDQQGNFYLDAPKNNIAWPILTPRSLDRWLVAARLLSQEVWGVTFRHPERPIKRDFEPKLAESVKPKRPKQAPKTAPDEPFIKTLREDGKRQYAVCYGDGTIAVTKPHRGQAAKELHRLKESSR